MNVTCLIRYEIDPYQQDAFKEYAQRAMAQAKRFILREERSFVQAVDGTFGVAAAPIP